MAIEGYWNCVFYPKLPPLSILDKPVVFCIRRIPTCGGQRKIALAASVRTDFASQQFPQPQHCVLLAKTKALSIIKENIFSTQAFSLRLNHKRELS